MRGFLPWSAYPEKTEVNFKDVSSIFLLQEDVNQNESK